jgi:hydroxymethylpyrimidine pyrophosphatase-like HAD family hydrolase
MIKMVVSSFYNALIDPEDAIPTSTMLEIERIRKKGILFCVATNRSYREVLEYNKDFPFVDYIVSLNGSYIYDVGKGNCLSKNKLTTASIKKMKALFGKYPIKYYTEKEELSDLVDIENTSVYKIEVEIEDEAELKKLQKINVETSIFEYRGKKYLEVISNKSSMFFGTDQVALKTGTTLKEIIAICANESDCSLVKNIERSYIVKNSPEKLRRIAKKVTYSNADKGVENILRRIK